MIPLAPMWSFIAEPSVFNLNQLERGFCQEQQLLSERGVVVRRLAFPGRKFRIQSLLRDLFFLFWFKGEGWRCFDFCEAKCLWLSKQRLKFWGLFLSQRLRGSSKKFAGGQSLRTWIMVSFSWLPQWNLWSFSAVGGPFWKVCYMKRNSLESIWSLWRYVSLGHCWVQLHCGDDSKWIWC